MQIDNVAAGFAAVFGPIYKDAILNRAELTDNGKGGMANNPIDVPCKVQVAALTQAQREQGYAESSVRLLILKDGLADWVPDGRVKDDDEITILTPPATYRVAAPSLDALAIRWECVGRLKP